MPFPLRNIKSIINAITAPIGVRVLSTAEWKQTENCRVSVGRLQRDKHLLGLCLRAPPPDTMFETRWREFLLANLERETAVSELGQDLFALFLLGNGPNRYYVEFGAYDGVTGSNTFMLEKRGWAGLLVEPLRDAWKACKRNRTATVIHAAVDPKCVGGGTATIIRANLQSSLAVDDGRTSDKEHLRALDVNKRREAVRLGQVEKTPLVSLPEILPERRIDFMSVDIEGGEEDFADSFAFNRYDVQALTIEHNWRSGGSDRLDSALRPHGLVRVLAHFSGRDAWYAHSSIFSRLNS